MGMVDPMNAQDLLDHALGQLEGPAGEQAERELAADAALAATFDRLTRALDRLLDDLPPLVKRTFLLAQVDGLGQAEIARELGISLATVKRYLNKAALRCYFAL